MVIVIILMFNSFILKYLYKDNLIFLQFMIIIVVVIILIFYNFFN